MAPTTSTAMASAPSGSGTATSADDERCPLCPSSGPPTRTSTQVPAPPSNGFDALLAAASDSEAVAAEEAPDLVWISCSKCSDWFHAVCLLLAQDERWRSTVSDKVMEEIEANWTDQGAWTDWTKWADRWYCRKCIDQSLDPANPHPPRHPLTMTLKKSFPPKRKLPAAPASAHGTPRSHPPSHQLKRSSPSPSSTPARRQSPIASKRARLSSPHNRGAAGNGDEAKEAASPAATVQDGKDARPKRKAAENRPDYHALHNQLGNSTAKWLDLIAHPEKYGRKIVEGKFPRIPGKLLTKEWVESPPPTTNAAVLHASSSASGSRPSSPLTPTPHQPVQYPPHLPPTLFYGPQREPLIVGKEDGGFESLGGRIPDKGLTVPDIANLVGPDRPVEVIDVTTQQSTQWPLRKWSEHISTPLSSSSISAKKIYNIISLEISGTELAKKVRPPRLVREVDWVDNFWNFGPGGKMSALEREERSKSPVKAERQGSEIRTNGTKVEEGMTNGEIKMNGHGGMEAAVEKAKGEGPEKGKTKAAMSWPKVQLYCLMGMKGAWTDWHIDFAASSVYYTVHTGAKTFFFIRPTEANLKAYRDWSGSFEKQQDTWLGDMCDEVRKVTLRAGDTMIIPSGYIHAVHTPEDSIVFGGNFLHSYDIPTQLRLRQIEIDTKVPRKFTFPHLDKLCWYVADAYLTQLQHHQAIHPPRSSAALHRPASPHPRVLQGLRVLVTFLLGQVALTQQPADNFKNMKPDPQKRAWDSIPSEVAKDPEGLVKELKWRVERELGIEDGTDEAEAPSKLGKAAKGAKEDKGKGGKRKVGGLADGKSARTYFFDPPPWEITSEPIQTEETSLRLVRPGADVATDMPEEDATEIKIIVRTSRSRVTHIDDGRTVLEEQDEVFTERRTIWQTKEERNEKEGGEGMEGMCVDG